MLVEHASLCNHGEAFQSAQLPSGVRVFWRKADGELLATLTKEDYATVFYQRLKTGEQKALESLPEFGGANVAAGWGQFMWNQMLNEAMAVPYLEQLQPHEHVQGVAAVPPESVPEGEGKPDLAKVQRLREKWAQQQQVVHQPDPVGMVGSPDGGKNGKSVR